MYVWLCERVNIREYAEENTYFAIMAPLRQNIHILVKCEVFHQDKLLYTCNIIFGNIKYYFILFWIFSDLYRIILNIVGMRLSLLHCYYVRREMKQTKEKTPNKYTIRK